MERCQLKQSDLLEVLDAPLDRVKGLTSGRIKKLKQSEMEALVTKLRIRPDWLVSGGQGAMFLTGVEHARWLTAHAIPPALQAEIRQLQERAPAWPESEPPRSAAEATLLSNWRLCNKRDQATISDLAARLATPAK